MTVGGLSVMGSQGIAAVAAAKADRLARVILFMPARWADGGILILAICSRCPL